jgi:hypothetical protein
MRAFLKGALYTLLVVALVAVTQAFLMFFEAKVSG